jgi:DNA primase large subunit
LSQERVIELTGPLSELYRQNYYDAKGYTAFTDKVQVYAVPFFYVNNLVRSRRVLIERGKAYLFNIHLKEYVKQHYRSKLSEAMATIYKIWPSLEDKENDRLLPFLVNAANKGQEAGPNAYKAMNVFGRQVTPDMIDDLSNQSFPLCMKVLHKSLRADHKLKHMGRMQYGLFLKGLGLNLENALQFWQDEFTKIMPESDFVKTYSYNIRHSYGKEGKQTNYSPYGCMKIITGMSRPGADEHHGCPFKNFDERNLRVEMTSVKDKNQVDEIINLVKGSHYQVACRRYFEVTHPDINATDKEMAKEDDGAPFLHPNVYFTQSRRLLEAKDKLDKAQAANNTTQPMDVDKQ